MAWNDDSLELAGGISARNICVLFNGMDEEHSVLRPFFKDGFDHGEKAVHIVDPSSRTSTSRGCVRRASTWSRRSHEVSWTC
jgi:hypothetical protein